MTAEHKPPWVYHLEGRIGWTEFDHDHEIAKDWPIVDLPQFKTVIGTEHAWCGLACAIALHSANLSYPKSAAWAPNWRHFGKSCGYICGSFLGIRHANGGAHVTCFLYWVDESKKLAACLGGNQSNAYRITTFNLSGNVHGCDEVINGPRWPLDYPLVNYVYDPGKSDFGTSTR